MFYQTVTADTQGEGHQNMKTTVSVIDKRGNDATAIVEGILRSLHKEQNSEIRLVSSSTQTTEESRVNLREQSTNSSILVGYALPRSLSTSGLHYFKLDNAAMILDGTLYSPIHIPLKQNALEKMPNLDPLVIGETVLKNTEGDFSFMIIDDNKIVAGRDIVGVQPLYYGENRTKVAFASNRKALWKLGIETPKSFPPGNMGVATSKGLEFTAVKNITYSETEPITMQKAAKNLQKLLEQAVKMRVMGLKDVAVAFSGGLDSSLIAALAKKCEANVCLFHVSLENHHETVEAKKVAEALSLPIQTHLYKESDVETVLPKVVGLVEESDPLKSSIGVAMYWVAQKAAEAGFHVLLAGQGADELFGGYKRYVDQYVLHGAEEVRKTLYEDVRRLHENNIERDVKICNFHDIQLRLPFATYQIADFALKLPMELKIERKQDSLRKLVLRRVSENLNLPASISNKPKKAVQYATGINNTLRQIAKSQKTTLKEYIDRIFISNTRN
jgi:asparagine synthase (glutamine-hydrolysing)